MRRKDLAVGDRVFVVLPYDGGCGWAKVLDLDADPKGNRPTWSILVRFESGQTARNVSSEGDARLVAPNHIVRLADPSETQAMTDSTEAKVTLGARVVLIDLPTLDNAVTFLPVDDDLWATFPDAREIEGPLVNGIIALTFEARDDETEEALLARVRAGYENLAARS